MTTKPIHIIPRNDGRVIIRVESDIEKDTTSSCESIEDVVDVITKLLTQTFTPPSPTTLVGDGELAEMIYACRSGSNPCGPNANYSCGACGLELNGDEVGFVAAGDTYANGEFAPCPQCGNEHSIDRDDENENN